MSFASQAAAARRSPPAPPALVWLAALAALAAGALLYAGWRAPGSAMLLPAALHAPALAAALPLAGIAGWLPSALHAFAFALLCAMALGSRGAVAQAGCCAGWATIETLFEAAQHPVLAAPLLARLDAVPQAEPLARYLRQGTFDAADVAAAWFGALLALALLRAAMRRATTEAHDA